MDARKLNAWRGFLDVSANFRVLFPLRFPLPKTRPGREFNRLWNAGSRRLWETLFGAPQRALFGFLHVSANFKRIFGTLLGSVWGDAFGQLFGFDDRVAMTVWPPFWVPENAPPGTDSSMSVPISGCRFKIISMPRVAILAYP